MKKYNKYDDKFRCWICNKKEKFDFKYNYDEWMEHFKINHPIEFKKLFKPILVKQHFNKEVQN